MAAFDDESGMMDKRDTEERRLLRKRYRGFIDELNEKKEELIQPGSSALGERLDEGNTLFSKVKNPREAVLDANAMCLMATMGRQKAQALHTEFVRFQPTEYAEKLISFIGGQNQTQTDGSRIPAAGWTKLGNATQPFFKRAPNFTYMCGSFERGPRPIKEPRKAKEKTKDNTVGKETVLKQLKNFRESDNNEVTTEEVERVFDILKDKYQEYHDTPLDYFEFILNPDSFGHTIENMFHTSFLIRDGLAVIELDDDGLPVIYPADEQVDKTKKKADEKRHQTIMSLTPADWKEMVEIFKVETATITPRASQQENVPSNGNT